MSSPEEQKPVHLEPAKSDSFFPDAAQPQQEQKAEEVPQPAPVEAKPEEKTLNPAQAAREAIFNVVKDREMTVDEQVSAIAPLIKTISSHRMVVEPVEGLEEEDTSPRAHQRWSMLEEEGTPLPATSKAALPTPDRVERNKR